MEHKHNILVIEDEESIASVIKVYLEKEGYRVFNGFTGKEALNIIQQEEIDFVILDLIMKSVNYTNLNRLQTLVASIVMGCNYTSDINEKLVPDTTAAKLLGMNKFPDQSQINRFLNRFAGAIIHRAEFIDCMYQHISFKKTKTVPI